MKTKTLHYQLGSDFVLHEPSGSSLPVVSPKLAFLQKNGSLHVCRLSFHVDPELYQQIDAKALFNLDPNLRGNLAGKEFVATTKISITANLNPELLLRFTPYLENLEDATDYLKTLNQEQPDDPLLLAESWYALRVEQQHQGKQIGYRTLWHYLKLSASTADAPEPDTLMRSLVDFLTKERQDVNLEALDLEGWQQLLDGDLDDVLNGFNGLTTELESLLKNLKNEDETASDSTDSPLLEIAANFFTQDNWQTYRSDDGLMLHMIAQGQNGQWNCQVAVNEERQQVVFYSICPANVPETKYSSMMEFLTLANFGLVIGNFELDWSDGQIRYKTAINVNGDRLTTALVQGLAYANVLTMDRYLPGIMSVIYGNVSPKDAIAQAEN